MLQFMHDGGIFMWFILAVSFFGIAVILERGYVLFWRYSLNTKGFLRTVLGYVDHSDYTQALSLCNAKAHHPLARVLRAGLQKANKPDKEIQRAMEEEALEVIPEIQARTAYLSMISNVATLLGLLGTIQGLIDAFKAIGEADAAAKQDALAQGISVAMYTTAFGLIVAIPCVAVFFILNSKATRLISTIDSASAKLYGKLINQNKKLVNRVA